MTDLTRKRGDTYADQIVVVDSTGVVVDITGYSFVLTVDPSNAPSSAANNLFSLTGGIIDAVNGVVEFAPTALQADQAPGRYWYDVQMTDVGAAIRTIVTGRYTIEQDISK